MQAWQQSEHSECSGSARHLMRFGSVQRLLGVLATAGLNDPECSSGASALTDLLGDIGSTDGSQFSRHRASVAMVLLASFYSIDRGKRRCLLLQVTSRSDRSSQRLSISTLAGLRQLNHALGDCIDLLLRQHVAELGAR